MRRAEYLDTVVERNLWWSGWRAVKGRVLAGLLTAMAVSLVAGVAVAGQWKVRMVEEIDADKFSELTEARGLLFFRADFYGGPSFQGLWRSDGTEAGTHSLSSTYPLYPTSLFNANGTLYFGAVGSMSGRELWKSDGTVGGTVMVKDINDGADSSSAQTFAFTNGELFFTADDGVAGRELWKSDGTVSGTVRVRDIHPGPGSSSTYTKTVSGGVVFFAAIEDWPGAGSGRELWKSDGTVGGTVRVMDINPGPDYSFPRMPSHLVDCNGVLFFAADNGTNGEELWKSDGTGFNTVMVMDINPGPASSTTLKFATCVNGTLFFVANDGVNGLELWKSDGTVNGAVMVDDLNPGSHSSPRSLTDVGGTLFFSADDGTHGREPWKSDGSPGGTVMIKDIWPGTTGGGGYDFTDVNGTVFFPAADAYSNPELWMTDGSKAGTVVVEDTNPSWSSGPQQLTRVGDRLFFLADDGTHGEELWVAEWFNTHEGPGVEVTVLASDGNEITLTFDNVTTAGNTEAVRIDCDTLGPLPSQFSMCKNTEVCYEISTSATFTSSGDTGVQVCVPYGHLTDCVDPGKDHLVKLAHDRDGNGQMESITDQGQPAGGVVCGTTSHLSPFAVVFECVIEMTCPATVSLETGPGARECGVRRDLPAAAVDAACGLDRVTDPAQTLYPVGSTTVPYDAEDLRGNTASCSTTVDVSDTTPPEVESSESILACLAPSNHEMRCFERGEFTPMVWDNCPGVMWTLTGCVSDQPEDGLGDGHTSDDCVMDPAREWVCARAERSGLEKDGRSYTLGVEATDTAGNSSGETGFGRLFVPHDRGAGLPEECR